MTRGGRPAHGGHPFLLRASAIVAAAALWHGLAPAARAQGAPRTLADYRLRLLAAADRLDDLAEVRAILPPSERVAAGRGAGVEADNGWLHAELGAYEQSYNSPPRERAVRLRGASARLRALAARVAELEAQAVGAPRDKDAEKGRLAAILRGPDFAEKAPRGGPLSRMLERVKEWLRKLVPKRPLLRPGASGRAATAAQVFVYALALGVVAYVLWRYRRRARKGRGEGEAARGPRVVLGERLEPGQTAADLLADAERLARGGDLRGAIRKAYVALLCELGDRRVVRLAQHKTNRDYLQAVRELAPQLYAAFQPLTQAFERHWYGLERATEEDWDDFRAGCRRALAER